MGKKKERQNSSQDDEASESCVPQCLHVRKAVNLNLIKKQLLQRCWNVCDDCKANTKTEEKHELDDDPAVWLCLKCGHQGCGRNSEEQHAFKHHEKQHSEPHCVVLNLDCWAVWCYLCDEEIHYEVKDQLGQFVAYIQKKTTDKCVKGAMVSQTNEKTKGKEDNTTETGKHEKGKTVAQLNQQIPILSQTYVLHELIQQLKMNGSTLTIMTPDSLNLGQLEIHLDQPGPLSSAMRQFLLDFQDTKKNVITPKELFTQVCKKAVRFKGFQQQDSQELLRYLLDGMRTEEIKRIGAGIVKALNYSSEMMENEESRKTMKAYEKEGSMLNFVDQVFGGKMTSTIMCEECKMVTLVEESFLDLSLPVLDEQIDKKKPLGKSGRNIVDEDQNDNRGDCDGNFISKNRDDVSTGTSKYQQKKAKKQAKKAGQDEKKVYTNARKQMLVSSPPPILTLHLKRFQQLGFNLRKINKHIHFPQVLDLAPFCALNCKNVTENCTNVLYNLYGVVEHSGTMRSGHYTAYVKVRTPSSSLTEYAMNRCTLSEIKEESHMGSWFHISDTRVQAVPETKVLSAQAYLLFYERIL